MNNVIIENTEEEDDDLTPDSAVKAYQERKDSFKTNAFNSVDSFVQLEN